MKTKGHALLTEIQLGRSVMDVAESLLEDADCTLVDEETLEKFIKKLIEINKPNKRFHVFYEWTDEDKACLTIRQFGEEWPSDLTIEYLLEDYDEDDAGSDCDFLNEVIRKLFLVKDAPKKARINCDEFNSKKGKICPFCGGKRVVSLIDNMRVYMPERHWVAKRNMACAECECEWAESYNLVLDGFETL